MTAKQSRSAVLHARIVSKLIAVGSCGFHRQIIQRL